MLLAENAQRMVPNSGDQQDGAPKMGTTSLTLNQQPRKKEQPRPIAQAGPAPVQPAAAQPAQTPTSGMTFAQMQQQGYARPAPPPATPTPPPTFSSGVTQGGYGGGAQAGGASGGSGPVQVRGDAAVQDATRQMLMQQLANPAGFGQAEVQQWYDRGAQDIDDQFAMQNTALREEMARRGLSDSSIMGGRLADLNVAKRSAQVDLTDRLGRQLAEEMAAARSRAIGQGMDYDKYMQDMSFRNDELGLAGDRLRLDADLGFGNLGIQQGKLNLDSALGFGALDLDQRKFGESQYQFDTDLGQRQSEFDRNYGLDRDRLNETTRQFDQNYGLDRDRFAEDQRQFDERLGFDRDQFGWLQDQNLMDLFNNTDFLNPDTTPMYDPAMDPAASDLDFDYSSWWR